MFSAKPKTPRPTGCCAQQMKRFHSLTAGQPFDTNPVRGAAAPLTTPRKGFFDSLFDLSGQFWRSFFIQFITLDLFIFRIFPAPRPLTPL